MSDPTSVVPEPFTCKVRAAGLTDPPQDCDWPHCGCDPYADKVLAALQEEASAAPDLRALVRNLQRYRWHESGMIPRYRPNAGDVGYVEVAAVIAALSQLRVPQGDRWQPEGDNRTHMPAVAVPDAGEREP